MIKRRDSKEVLLELEASAVSLAEVAKIEPAFVGGRTSSVKAEPRRRGRKPNLSEDETMKWLNGISTRKSEATDVVEAEVARSLNDETDMTEVVAIDGGGKKKRKKSTSKKRTLENLIAESGACIRAKSWADAKPAILVGVYARGHFMTYNELMPTELEKEAEFLGACSAAAKVVRKLGTIEKAYAFMLWSWERERKRLAKNPERVFRMGWRIQFSDSMVNDYLTEVSFSRKRGKR